jgi:hypothetical protein
MLRSVKRVLPFRSTFGSSGGGSTAIIEKKAEKVEGLSAECFQLLTQRLEITTGIGFETFSWNEMNAHVQEMVENFFQPFTYANWCVQARFYATISVYPEQYLDWFKRALLSNPRCRS